MKMATEPGFTWIPPAELERRIDTIPLPKKVKSSFSRQISVWQSHSGTEWTVGRLKSFKDCLLNSYSIGGKRVSHKPEWFRTTPSGRLAGVFGDLWVIAMNGAASLKAVLFLVNVYTGVSRSDWNQDILTEISQSIERPSVTLPKRSHKEAVPARNWAYKALQRLGWYKGLKYHNKPVPITWQLPGKESHISRLAYDLTGCAGLPLLLPGASDLLSEAAGSWVCTGGNIYTLADVGSIHMTHEPGLKTRYFAAPNLVVQQALEPLKDSLMGFLAKVPWDCTLQQRRADKRILTALKQGKTVHSVDLSSATDAFPWDWQVAVLTNLLRGKEARSALSLFRAVVEQGYWTLPDGSQVRFSAGQPLGLGPSFPSFTLAHGILLYTLNGYKWNEDFFVLGDDVIIFDDRLHEKYRKVLQGWRVEVSEAKSFSSCNIAQFAGVTYTSNGSFWIPKWRPMTGATLLDLAAWWYPGLTKGFKDHALIEWVLSLPAPYGIGRNPKGIPLSDRLTTEVVDELLLREARRETESKPSVTRLDVMTLSDVLRKKGVPDSTNLLISQMASDGLSLARKVFYHNTRHKPTGLSLHPYLTELAHGTEMGGYPRLRFNEGKVDPYTLGTLHSWKQLRSRVEAVKRPV